MLANRCFEVDATGLAGLMGRRGKAWAVAELVQNAWDTDAQNVAVRMRARPAAPLVELEVEDDDPRGFEDLSHAWTLFSPTSKRADPTKRGRFTLGEKTVFALCEAATVITVSGSVRLDADGRHRLRQKRERGTRVECIVRMTRVELAETWAFLQLLIPPVNTTVSLDGGDPVRLGNRVALRTLEAVMLQTELDEGEGMVRRTRATAVRIYEPREGEDPQLYERGIPVQASGCPWHLDVGQRVPLGMERDAVPPAYLRRLHVEVLNGMRDLLPDASASWVRAAAGDERAAPEAVRKVMDMRYGEKRVAYDPSDPEANALAVTWGYQVVHGGSLSAGEWDNAKKAGAILPAGKVTPSPNPYGPNGKPLRTIPSSDWTNDMLRVVARAADFYREVVGVKADIRITIANEPTWGFLATFGRAGRYENPNTQNPFPELVLNYGLLGAAWFAGPTDTIDELLIHEFAHFYESNHLSERYHDALCRLGAQLTKAVREGRML